MNRSSRKYIRNSDRELSSHLVNCCKFLLNVVLPPIDYAIDKDCACWGYPVHRHDAIKPIAYETLVTLVNYAGEYLW
jgi:hypothetical protein